MAKADTDKLVESLGAMTVLELVDLKNKLEEEWGVTAAAPMAVAAAPAAGRRGRRRGGEVGVRRRPHRGGRSEDPGDQGRPSRHGPRPQGGQGPRRRRAERGQGGRRARGGRPGQGAAGRSRRHGRAQVARTAVLKAAGTRPSPLYAYADSVRMTADVRWTHSSPPPSRVGATPCAALARSSTGAPATTMHIAVGTASTRRRNGSAGRAPGLAQSPAETRSADLRCRATGGRRHRRHRHPRPCDPILANVTVAAVTRH